MNTCGTKLLRAWVALLVVTATSAQADDKNATNLIVHASGFAYPRGQAIASLFYEDDDIFNKPRERMAAAIQEDKAILLFPNVKPGHYAVLVFHDENGNSELDHNALRFPAEPLGFSNDFALTVFSGMPTFKKLRLTYQTSAEAISILVK